MAYPGLSPWAILVPPLRGGCTEAFSPAWVGRRRMEGTTYVVPFQIGYFFRGSLTTAAPTVRVARVAPVGEVAISCTGRAWRPALCRRVSQPEPRWRLLGIAFCAPNRSTPETAALLYCWLAVIARKAPVAGGFFAWIPGFFRGKEDHGGTAGLDSLAR